MEPAGTPDKGAFSKTGEGTGVFHEVQHRHGWRAVEKAACGFMESDHAILQGLMGKDKGMGVERHVRVRGQGKEKGL